MTKSESIKCEKLMEEAIKNAEAASRSWEKHKKCKMENNMIDAEIAIREFDYHRGYAEGINQALVVIGFKHEQMKKLQELILK